MHRAFAAIPTSEELVPQYDGQQPPEEDEYLYYYDDDTTDSQALRYEDDRIRVIEQPDTANAPRTPSSSARAALRKLSLLAKGGGPNTATGGRGVSARLLSDPEEEQADKKPRRSRTSSTERRDRKSSSKSNKHRKSSRSKGKSKSSKDRHGKKHSKKDKKRSSSGRKHRTDEKDQVVTDSDHKKKRTVVLIPPPPSQNSRVRSTSLLQQVKNTIRRRGSNHPSEPTTTEPAAEEVIDKEVVDTNKNKEKEPTTIVPDPSMVLCQHAVHWMNECCPNDVIPYIYAFLGPKLTQTLGDLTPYFESTLAEEQTWKVLCEELYKWDKNLTDEYDSDDDDDDSDYESESETEHFEEDDEKEEEAHFLDCTQNSQKLSPPVSWKDYYMRNPCVPVDYPTVEKALKAAMSVVSKHQVVGEEQVESGAHPNVGIRVLLRPGQHYVKRALLIEGTSPDFTVSFETMELPSTKAVLKPTLGEEALLMDRGCPPPFEAEELGNPLYARMDVSLMAGVLDAPPAAVLVSKRSSSIRNEPLIRVVQGRLFLKNVVLNHRSLGTDIWNGNAAVHIRPLAQSSSSESPPAIPRASVAMDHVELQSQTGRGIVSSAGAHLWMRDTWVHDCAATGVYVGGVGARARLLDCDIVNNGTGNMIAGGVSRGHSGIFLDQGTVDLLRSNVSLNTAAGISVISATDATLNVAHSDIIANGGIPMEVPFGSLDRHDIQPSNRISAVGPVPAKSTMLRRHLFLEEAKEREEDAQEVMYDEFIDYEDQGALDEEVGW